MRVRISTKLGFKNPKHVIGLVVLNNYTAGYWEDEGTIGLAAFEPERPPPVTCERACPKADVGEWVIRGSRPALSRGLLCPR